MKYPSDLFQKISDFFSCFSDLLPEEEPPWSSLEATVSDSAMATPNLLHSSVVSDLRQPDPRLPFRSVHGMRGRVRRATKMTTVSSAALSAEPASWAASPIV